MVSPLFPAAQAAALERIDARGQVTDQLFWHDTWTAWTKHRPVGAWDDGTEDERWISGTSGVGDLTENGPGGMTEGDGVIFPESPYRLAVLASAGFIPGVTHLVINDTRLFRVDAFKVEGPLQAIGNAYLRELLNTPMPVEGAP